MIELSSILCDKTTLTLKRLKQGLAPCLGQSAPGDMTMSTATLLIQMLYSNPHPTSRAYSSVADCMWRQRSGQVTQELGIIVH